ncbi:MAG: endolytic transglycosylase MltG [Kineosporiaceae bacterium]
MSDSWDDEVGVSVAPALPSRRSRREEEQAQEKAPRRRRRRSVTTLLVVSLLVVAGIGGAWLGLRSLVSSFGESDDFPGPGSGQVQVVVASGDTGLRIGRALAEAGVIKSAKKFREVASADARSSSIQPGTYVLRKEMTSAAALEVLVDPSRRVVRKVTIREGLRVAQVLSVLEDKGGFDPAELKDALRSPELGLPASAKGVPEGYLFPATYEFQPSTTALEALQDMVAKSRETLADLGVPEAREHEVLTKAGLIQAEAGSAEDMPKVARVFENRLAQGWKLQSDATVSYATGRFGVTTTQADRDTPSPYNTYYTKGLPAGPISNPGEAAMRAALQPAKGDWMFFVTVDPSTGETVFSRTSAQHEQARLRLQKWLRDNGQ